MHASGPVGLSQAATIADANPPTTVQPCKASACPRMHACTLFAWHSILKLPSKSALCDSLPVGGGSYTLSEGKQLADAWRTCHVL